MSQAALKAHREKEKAIPWKPPSLETYAEAGDVVQWFPSADPDASPHVALVTQVGIGGVLTVNTFHPDLRDCLPMDGCRHMDDEKVKNGNDTGGGGWRHKPLTVLLRRAAIAQNWLAWDRNTGRLVAGDETPVVAHVVRTPTDPPPAPKV